MLTLKQVDRFIEACEGIKQELKAIGLNDAATPLGAIEAHAKAVADAGSVVAGSITDVARAIRALADSVREAKF